MIPLRLALLNVNSWVDKETQHVKMSHVREEIDAPSHLSDSWASGCVVKNNRPRPKGCGCPFLRQPIITIQLLAFLNFVPWVSTRGGPWSIIHGQTTVCRISAAQQLAIGEEVLSPILATKRCQKWWCSWVPTLARTTNPTVPRVVLIIAGLQRSIRGRILPVPNATPVAR